jgi:hypothetical protein
MSSQTQTGSPGQTYDIAEQSAIAEPPGRDMALEVPAIRRGVCFKGGKNVVVVTDND